MSAKLLEKVAHRPFPVPTAPWVMSQSWAQLLFAHWPIDADKMRQLIPESLDLDLFDGHAWIGVVPFAMRDVCPRYAPKVGPMSNFLELNVRTYVKRNGIAGVYFFSLDCSNSIACWIARKFYHLPYFSARMTSSRTSAGEVHYESQRKEGDVVFKATYRPTGGLLKTSADSIDKFLTERYCLYTTDSVNRLYTGVIHHDVWPLQPAEAQISVNTMTDVIGLKLPELEPLLHYSERIDTIVWPLALVV